MVAIIDFFSPPLLYPSFLAVSEGSKNRLWVKISRMRYLASSPPSSPFFFHPLFIIMPAITAMNRGIFIIFLCIPTAENIISSISLYEWFSSPMIYRLPCSPCSRAPIIASPTCSTALSAGCWHGRWRCPGFTSPFEGACGSFSC